MDELADLGLLHDDRSVEAEYRAVASNTDSVCVAICSFGRLELREELSHLFRLVDVPVAGAVNETLVVETRTRTHKALAMQVWNMCIKNPWERY